MTATMQYGVAVSCERLVKIHRLGALDVPALAGLDLAVDAGEIVGMVGPSGCGKTTLLNIIGGLLAPTSGRVVVGGADVSALTGAALDHYRRTTVGFVWQETSANLLPHLDILTNVCLPLRLQHVRGPRATSRARDLLELLGLADHSAHRPYALSGGQQQRAAIAVALAASPSLLLADEPTGALDLASAAAVYEALRAVRDEFGVTVLIVSHDPDLAAMTDRVVELRDGQTSVELRADDVGNGRSPDEAVLLVDTTGRVRLPDGMRSAIGITDRVAATLDHRGIVLRSTTPPQASPGGGDLDAY